MRFLSRKKVRQGDAEMRYNVVPTAAPAVVPTVVPTTASVVVPTLNTVEVATEARTAKDLLEGGLPRANGPVLKIPQDTEGRLSLRSNVLTMQAKPNWPKRSPTFPGLRLIRHRTALERLTRFLVFSGAMWNATILKMTSFPSMIRPISKLVGFWGEVEMETSF
jgi:hypothetical protein